MYVLTANYFLINRCRFLWTPWMCGLLYVDQVCSPLMLDQAFAQYFMLYSPVSSCVCWRFCCDWLFSSQGVEKAHFFISGRISRLVYSLAVCPFAEIVLSVIDHLCVVARACEERRGEERDCLCERVHEHTFIQPPGEAESVECRGMPFLDWSSVLLQTGEFCTLHSVHNTWFTLSHQRKQCCTHPLYYRHTLSFTVKTFLMSEIKPCHSSPVH